MQKINYSSNWNDKNNTSGVYKIEMGSHIYIGSTSRKIKVRIQEHIRLLLNNKHYNKKMQYWFNKENIITISILENCSFEIWKKEQFYINVYAPDINVVKHVAKYE